LAGTKLTSQAIHSSGIFGGWLIINSNEKNEVKLYLLGQLDQSAAERLELRLLTDAAFGEEFDVIVNEITDGYVGNELRADDRKRVQQYFLRSTERQNKLRFASELLERAAIQRAPASVVQAEPGMLERVRAFWGNMALLTRFATTFAAIVIVAGVLLLTVPGTRTSGTYAVVNLTISNSERASGSEIKQVRLEPGSPGIQIELALPDQIPQSKNYRVELLAEKQASRNLRIEQQTEAKLVVVVPANEIGPGSYFVRLYATNPDGTEQRIRGTYFFAVQ
jgi:methionine-rich copper-binding protein CopC